MPKQMLTASEAARRLGVSLDTLRRWDRQGKIRVRRDAANRRLVPLSEVERLRVAEGEHHVLSARNRFRGGVVDVKVEGLLAQVELETTQPARVVAVITREAAEQLALRPGMEATALVKATSVMIER